jgi:hypothetical protein
VKLLEIPVFLASLQSDPLAFPFSIPTNKYTQQNSKHKIRFMASITLQLVPEQE